MAARAFRPISTRIEAIRDSSPSGVYARTILQDGPTSRRSSIVLGERGYKIRLAAGSAAMMVFVGAEFSALLSLISWDTSLLLALAAIVVFVGALFFPERRAPWSNVSDIMKERVG